MHEKFLNLEAEYLAFREHSLLSTDEKVTELNNQIASLNQTHSEYVAELSSRIEDLGTELSNVSALFETTTNQLGETENHLEQKNAELAELAADNEVLRETLAGREAEFETFKTLSSSAFEETLKGREIEYQKLLTENTCLIAEIDSAQDKIEAQDAEIDLLRTEMQELKMQSAGKTQDFKETLSEKNFQITNLEAERAALRQELSLMKAESEILQGRLQESSEIAARYESLQQQFEQVSTESASVGAELAELQSCIVTLNITIQQLNGKLSAAETEISALQAGRTEKEQEREEQIERLCGQIDALNDQRLALLDEKEQMAGQLLKMNEVIGTLSQQVDSEQIDVTGLNNHRKNVILAGNSKGSADNAQMKTQINELVREIDKCIALLSA